MKRRLFIVCGLVALCVQATPHEALVLQHSDTLTVEQQQQFLYYFYETQRLIQAGKPDEAWSLLQFCMELNANDAAVNNYMGCYMEGFQDMDRARYFFMRAYELDPSEYWYRYALLLLRSQDKEAHWTAIRALEEVVHNFPKKDDACRMLQKAYLNEKQFADALALQDKIDSLDGYNAESAYQRYQLSMVLRQTKKAMEEVERYLDIDPDDYQFQVFRMQLYEQTEQSYEKLKTAYHEVIRLNPHNLLALNNLAWNMCIHNEDLQQAKAYSYITIMMEPTNSTYLDTYAWIMYKMKNYGEAKFFIEKALEKVDDATRKEVEQHYKAILKKAK